MNRSKFRHRSIQDYNLKCFNKLLDAIIKSGFKIECCGLIGCKPTMTESEKETFLKTLDRAKEKIYKQRAEEFATQTILESFCFTINKKLDIIFNEDLLEVKIAKKDFDYNKENKDE